GPGFVERAYSRRAIGDRLVAIAEETHAKATGRAVPLRPRGLYRPFKRACDLLAAVMLLIVFLPVLAAVAIAIRVDSKGPIVFRQRRVGRRSTEFTIFKFRTMSVGTPDLAPH